MPAVRFDAESMIQNALFYARRFSAAIMDVYGAYSGLKGVSALKDYISRGLALGIVPEKQTEYLEETQIVLPDDSQIKSLIKYYKDAGLSDNMGVFFIRKEARANASFESLLEIIETLKEELKEVFRKYGKKERDARVIDHILNDILFFGYSDGVFEQIRRALESGGVDTKLFDEQIQAKKKALDVSSRVIWKNERMIGGPNNKRYLREFLRKISAEEEYSFVENYNLDFISCEEALNTEKLRTWLRGKNRVVLKPANLASGEDIDIFDIGDEEEVQKLIRKIHNFKQRNIDLSQAIIEEAVPEHLGAKEFSAQFYVERVGYKFYVLPLAVTKQVIKGTAHQGNIISFDPTFTDSVIIKNKLLDMGKIVEAICEDSGYEGYISVDLKGDKDDFRILEMNARVTGATAPLVVLAGLQRKYADRLKDKEGKSIYLYAQSENTIEPSKSLQENIENDMDKLLELLRRRKLLWNESRLSGVIPSLAALPQKLGVIAIGKSEEETMKYMTELKRLLSAT